MFTHFSFTDYRNLLKQAQRFDALSAIYIREKGSVNKSCAASAGLCCGQRFLYDEVRAGLALYGYMPSRINFGLPLRKAMSVTVPIMAIKNVAKGEKIGYGGLYVADKDVKIGIIRGGYFDGISRAAAGMRVYVNGQETQLIGSVCMDLSFVLLDGIKADVGDNVILLGEENDARGTPAAAADNTLRGIDLFQGKNKQNLLFITICIRKNMTAKNIQRRMLKKTNRGICGQA